MFREVLGRKVVVVDDSDFECSRPVGRGEL